MYSSNLINNLNWISILNPVNKFYLCFCDEKYLVSVQWIFWRLLYIYLRYVLLFRQTWISYGREVFVYVTWRILYRLNINVCVWTNLDIRDRPIVLIRILSCRSWTILQLPLMTMPLPLIPYQKWMASALGILLQTASKNPSTFPTEVRL